VYYPISVLIDHYGNPEIPGTKTRFLKGSGDLPSTCSAKVPLGISSTISLSLEVLGLTLDVERIGVSHEIVRCSGG
jgi:hypothetical protein